MLVAFSKSIPTVSCDVVAQVVFKNLAEVWLGCNSVSNFLKSIELLSSSGVILSFGFLSGNVVRWLPAELESFLDLACKYVTVSGGEEVVAEVLGNLSRAIKTILPVAKKISIRKGGKTLRVVLDRDSDARIFFDASLRILEPIEVPPRMLPKAVKERRGISD